MTTYANKAATLAHMQRAVAINGQVTPLTVWMTAAGEWIDENVLRELAADGLVEVREAQRNMWSTPGFTLTQKGLETDPSVYSSGVEFSAYCAQVVLAIDIRAAADDLYNGLDASARRQYDARYRRTAALYYEVQQAVRGW